MLDQAQLGPLLQIAKQVYVTTIFVQENSISQDALPTSSHLSRQLGLPREKVKKLLKSLRNQGLVRPISLNPKRYCFDTYQFRQLLDTMDETHDDPTLYELVVSLSQYMGD